MHESHGSEVEHVREKSCMSYQQVKVKGKSEQRYNSKQVNRKKKKKAIDISMTKRSVGAGFKRGSRG